MRLNSNELFKAVRFALYAGAATAVGLTGSPVFAQEAGADKLETIVVTGSRIRKADVETAQPVLTIDRAQIEKQGFSSVADILLNVTAAGSPAFSRSDALTANESAGGSYIDLRDLGPQRTLVLVNGKRLGANSEGYQDVATIPVGIIERIDILKDGASSVYGSDAIAGVINIITRSRFEGAEANVYLGQYDEDDGERQQYDFTIGSTGERSSVTMSVSYAKEDPVWAKDRWFSKVPQPLHPGAGWSPVSQWGNLIPGGGIPGSYTLGPGFNGDPYDFNNYIRQRNNIQFPEDNIYYANSNEQMNLLSGMERTSVFVSGSFNITDNITFRSDVLYNKRETENTVAGYPLQSASLGAPMSADSYFNPFGSHHGFETPRSVHWNRRGWEVPRGTFSDFSTYRFTGGFEGWFDVGDHSWNWDVGYFYNKNDFVRHGTGNYNVANIAAALGPSFRNEAGVIQCGTAANPIPLDRCVPWNPLAPYGSGLENSLGDQAVQDFILAPTTSTGGSKTVNYTANLTGALFTLPAGDLSFAAGYEYRREEGDFVPDAMTAAGLTTELALGGRGGGYNVKEYYLELDIPVLKDIPFARELSFNVAGRNSDFNTFGKTTNGKFGLKWKPIDDLLIRGTYAEGFRAPTIGDLYGDLSQSYVTYYDPCALQNGGVRPPDAVSQRCTSGFGGHAPLPADYQQLGQGLVPCASVPCQTNYPFLGGANPFLQPETSVSKTLGAVYSPSYIQGLDITLDWYRIKIDNLVTTDSFSNILSDCYERGIVARCQNFTRNPENGAVNYLVYGMRNMGWIETEGYDLGVRYRLPEFSFGRFMITWETSYVTRWDSKSEPGTPELPFNNTGWNSAFRTKSNLQLDWSLGDFGATWGMRYYSGMKEDCTYDVEGGPECNDPGYGYPYWNPGNETTPPRVDFAENPVNRTGSNTFHDLQFRWTAPWNGTIAIGANNAFDHKGPFMYSNPNSQFNYYGGFDIGRFYYLKYQQRF
ncbi:TonB-dependent receptor plug domain-containing protein [Dokdonella koreensis]|uniref:Outer membrane vitamin B12 receptor BtuB n=1 Tax=Dokdonella koreensis DS-123 TaxID=1300342 RepID=A0A167GIR1_9GAMM|nr:TonB-dependent receptor [Dokdonella koreensis]ANB16602.1 Outer membrane vitamin B12 receptor BtuB [Dokdonella koreensis DS-123]